MKKCIALIATLFAISLLPGSFKAQAQSQDPVDEKCEVPIAKGNEVTRKLKILAKPEPEFSRQERRQYASQRIVLTAVFCGSGEVTQIRLKNGLSDSTNAKAIEA